MMTKQLSETGTALIANDKELLEQLPKFAAHLLHPEVKHFSGSEYEDALQWIREIPVPASV